MKVPKGIPREILPPSVTHPTETKEGPSPPCERDICLANSEGDICGQRCPFPFPYLLRKPEVGNSPARSSPARARTLDLSLPSAEHTRTPGSLHLLSGLPNAAPASQPLGSAAASPGPLRSLRSPPPSRTPPALVLRHEMTSEAREGGGGPPSLANSSRCSLLSPASRFPAPPFSRASPPRLAGAI